MSAVVEEITATCLQCQQESTGKFCHNCGTALALPRFTMHSLGHSLVHDLHLVENTFVRLTRDLALRPGPTIQGILDRRRKYMGPLSYYITSAALFAFAAVKVHYFAHMPVAGSNASAEVKKTMDEVMHLLEGQLKLISLVLIPIQAFFTWLVFKKQRYNYAEHLVMNLLAGGVGNVVWLFTCLPLFLIWPNVQANTLGFMLAMIIYSGVVFRHLFGQSWAKSIIKSVVAMMLFNMAVFLIMIMVAVAIVVKMKT